MLLIAVEVVQHVVFMQELFFVLKDIFAVGAVQQVVLCKSCPSYF